MAKIYLPSIFNEVGCINRINEPFIKLVKGGLQHRPFLNCDISLLNGANARAADMANKDYFGHIHSNGMHPNEVAVLYGYKLKYENLQTNNIESIVAGTRDAEAAYNALFNSEAHKPHIIGKDFFQNQTDFAVGYAENLSSRYKFYWVFWSAEKA